MLSLGARPFFVLAAAWAVFAVALWPAIWVGNLALPGVFTPIDWHAHELIFGYGGAVVAGFLLTAIANWTGRPPVAGARLGLLVLAWIAGRISVSFFGPSPALGIGLLFPLGLMGVAGTEILAAGNARNRKVIGVLGLLVVADTGFTLAVARGWDTAIAQRGGLAVLVLLILLIGGRVTPAFTRNWLKRNGIAGAIPEFGPFDAVAMAFAAVALGGWAWWPDDWQLAPLFALAGMFTLARLARWQGWAARRDWLLAVLHLGYLFASLGFVAAALHAIWLDWMPMAGVVHLWAVGAIGTTTMAMMTRATLGHTGQPLRADAATKLVYLALFIALAGRVGMAMAPQYAQSLLIIAVVFWCAGFGIFLARYGPWLLRR